MSKGITVASVFKSTEIPFIFAHDATDTDKKYTLATFIDKASGVNVIANNMPFVKSPITGETMVKANDQTLDITSDEIENFTKVAHCDNCQSVLRMEVNAGIQLQGHEIKCTVCGSALTVNVEVAEDLTSFDETETEAPVVTDDTGFEDVEPVEDVTDTESSDDTISDTDISDALGEDDTTETVDVTEGDTPITLNDIADDEMESASEDTDISIASAKNVKQFSAQAALQSKPEKNTKEFMLTELANTLDTDSSVEIVTASNGTNYLMMDNTPIGYIDISAIKNTSIQAKATNDLSAYCKAFMALAANSKITPSMLDEYGIKPIVVNVPFDLVEKASSTKAETEVFEKFKQSFAIAVSGFNKNVFTARNPIFEAMYTELSSIGYKDPESVIQRVANRAGNKYAKMVLEKAFEIAGKADESRNAYSELIETAAYQQVKAADTNLSNESDSSPAKSFSDKLANASVKISATASSAESSEAVNTTRGRNKFQALFP